MKVGIVRNTRDGTMLDLVAQDSCHEWTYVYGSISEDWVTEACEGQLLDNGGELFRGIVEVFIIRRDEWNKTLSELDVLRKLEDETH